MVIATMHGKEAAFGPALETAGFRWAVAPEFDTDRFGTFSGAIPRTGTMMNAARAKARAAFAHQDSDFALASEGAFGPHPVIGLLPGGRELVLLLHRETGTEILETLTTFDTNFSQLEPGGGADINAWLDQIGFPEHGVLVRSAPDRAPLTAGSRQELEAALARSDHGAVRLETDMRAHRNPTRMAVIAELADRLTARLCSPCPSCCNPGFGVVQRLPGLPCSTCGAPTPLIVEERFACPWCRHEARKARADGLETADPGECPACNP